MLHIKNQKDKKMNLIEKLKKEQEFIASQKAIENAEKKAKELNVKDQLDAISNIDFAEWFMTMINVGGKHFPTTIYGELRDKKKATYEESKIYASKNQQKEEKISSLIYSSNSKDNYVNSNTEYAGGEFRLCLGTKAQQKIKSGLVEMGLTLETYMEEPIACNQKPYPKIRITM